MHPAESVFNLGKNPHFSELRVIHSNQYYLGTMYLVCQDGGCESCREEYPWVTEFTQGKELDYNSRETGYFKDEAEAVAALEKYKKTGELDNQRY